MLKQPPNSSERELEIEQAYASDHSLIELTESELHTIFEPSDVAYLDEYQIGFIGNPKGFVARPVSPNFSTKYGDKIRLLANNETMYADKLEDELAGDAIITMLMEYRQRIGDPQELGMARRARRSVAAYILTRQVVVEMPCAIDQSEESANSLQEQEPA